MVTSYTLLTMSAKPRQMPAGEFKAKCLSVLDQVQRTGKTVVVTKRGRPVAQLMPLSSDHSGSLLGSVVYEEDLLSPIDAGKLHGSGSRRFV
jgi:prevent-host-death family protein